MLTAILNALSPVILVMALGYFLRRHAFLPVEFFKGLNKLIYWVGLPILLLVKLGTASLSLEPVIRLSAVLLIGTTAIALIALLLAYLLPISALSRGAFIQACFRGNQAFLALPIIVYSLTVFPEATAAKTLAIVALGPMLVYYNVLSILALIYTRPKDQSGRQHMSPWKSLFSNPLLIATVLGLLISVLEIPIATFLERSMLTVGQMSLPLALLAIGAGLSRKSLKGKLNWSFLVCGVKCVLAPLIAYALCQWLGLSRVETLIALIYMASPTAVAAYVLAQQLGGDEDLTGSSVVMSTLFSMLPLAIIIGVLS